MFFFPEDNIISHNVTDNVTDDNGTTASPADFNVRPAIKSYKALYVQIGMYYYLFYFVLFLILTATDLSCEIRMLLLPCQTLFKKVLRVLVDDHYKRKFRCSMALSAEYISKPFAGNGEVPKE